MSSAAFFGHRDVNYSQYSESIAKIVEVVVRNCGVNEQRKAEWEIRAKLFFIR